VQIRLTGAPALRLHRARGRPAAPLPVGFVRKFGDDRPRRFGLCLLLAFVASAFACSTLVPAAANDSSFPFGSAFFLDADPLPGSKRIPMIEIEDNGTAAFNLWCSTVEGTASVADDKISIVPTKAISAELILQPG
jgi:hypothetical protein